MHHAPPNGYRLRNRRWSKAVSDEKLYVFLPEIDENCERREVICAKKVRRQAVYAF